MTTEYFIIALFCRVDDQMPDAGDCIERLLNATLSIPKPGSIPARWSRLPSCSPSKALAIAPFTVGCSETTGICSLSCPAVPVCFGCSIPTGIGRSALWQSLPCSVCLTPMASNCSIRAGKAAASAKSARKGCRTAVGSWGQTVFCAQSSRPDRGLGCRHG